VCTESTNIKNTQLNNIQQTQTHPPQNIYVSCKYIPLLGEIDDNTISTSNDKITETINIDTAPKLNENSSPAAPVKMCNDVNISIIKILNAQQVNTNVLNQLGINNQTPIEEFLKKLTNLLQSEHELKRENIKLKSEVEELTTERNILRALLLKGKF